MKKGILILLIIVGLLILFLVVSNVMASMAPIARLIVNQGTVQVDKGMGFMEAKSGMAMKEGYAVKTLAGSKATIIFLESSVLRLNENTEIKIQRVNSTSVSVSQKAGDTWTKLLKVSGISDYEIETPNAVASVRGTAFSVSVGNGTEIGVLEGTVQTTAGSATINVTANYSVFISDNESELLEAVLLIRNQWINDNDFADKEFIKAVKARLKSKYSLQIMAAKIAMKANDDDVNKQIDDFVEGRLSIKKSIEEGKIPGALLPLIPKELSRA